MRLIDADLLQETLAREPMENRTYLRANEIAVDAPTAYDVDGVIEEIRQLECMAIPRYKGGGFGDYEGTDYYVKQNEVLDILKNTTNVLN